MNKTTILVIGSAILAAALLLSAAAPALAATQTDGLDEATTSFEQAVQRFERRLPLRSRLWPFQGDKIVNRGLLKATNEITGLEPKEILQALRKGESLASIAEAGGSSAGDILSAFESQLEEGMAQAVADGKLPEHMAEARQAWYLASARIMLELPRMAPAYPGLHELHVVLITGAVQASELDRAQVREQLEACRTLDDILAEAGSSSQAAVDQSMSWIDKGLARLVKAERLSQEMADEWQSSLREALQAMTSLPGLHVAGKECTE